MVAKHEDENFGCLGGSDFDFCHFFDCLLLWGQLHQKVNIQLYVRELEECFKQKLCASCADSTAVFNGNAAMHI